MADPSGKARGNGSVQRRRRTEEAQPRLLDTELEHLPPELRWREWMGRVEAVIFAANAPVTRDTLTRVVGNSCNLDLIIDDIRAELSGRPYELVSVAGGWQQRTNIAFGDVIRAATGQGNQSRPLTPPRKPRVDVHRLLSADHAGRARPVLWQGGQSRPHRCAAIAWLHRLRAA